MKENKKISYACDTTLCDNYYKMCDTSDYMLSDVNGLATWDMHVGLEDYKELQTKYPNCKFYAIHISDDDTSGIDSIYFPNDGDFLEI